MRGVSSEHSAILEVGDGAPDFELPALIGGVKKRFHLGEELERKNIVLAFYPSNWEPVSARQMSEYQSERDQFTAASAEVVGICVDSIMNTTEWEREIGPFDYPLCSDFWPHGEVSRGYGVFRSEQPLGGASQRAVFVIDRSAKIVFRKVYGMEQVPPLVETLEALHVR